jgi:hypothetical protein
MTSRWGIGPRWLVGGGVALAAGGALAADIAPRERYDGAVVPMAIHAGPFELAWGPHVQRVKDLYGIDLELIGIPVTELFDKQRCSSSRPAPAPIA